jgi:hypothetical protein
MAVTKTIIKQNHIEAIVKVVNDVAGAGSSTISLATDLLKSNEELSGETPTVNLGSVEATCSNNSEINITRNGVVIMNMFENFEQFELPWGADPQNNTHDLVVNFTGKGTVYIRLLKLKGYRSLFRPEQGVNL